MSSTLQSPPVTPPPFAPPPPPRRSLAAVTVGLVLIATGTVALLVTLGVDVPVAILAPGLLILLGLGVVVSAVRGESSGGLVGVAVFLGVLLALGAMLGALLDVPIRGGVGDRLHRPVATSELEDEYRLLAGTLVVDLRDVLLDSGTTEVEVSTVLGEVRVQLPDGMAVAVDSDVGAGSADVLGVIQDGLSVDNDRQTQDYETADRRLHLRVAVGLGEVTVTR